jgi:hypothetical protein
MDRRELPNLKLRNYEINDIGRNDYQIISVIILKQVYAKLLILTKEIIVKLLNQTQVKLNYYGFMLIQDLHHKY